MVVTRNWLIFDKWNYFSHDARRSWEHGIENLNLKFQSRWRIHQQAAQARCINYGEFRYCVIFYFFFYITNHLKNLYVQFNIIYAPSLDRLWYNQSCIHLSSLIRDVAFLISSTRHTTYSSTHLLPYCCFLLLVVDSFVAVGLSLPSPENHISWKPVLTFISSIRTLINKRYFSIKWLWEIYIFHKASFATVELVLPLPTVR